MMLRTFSTTAIAALLTVAFAGMALSGDVKKGKRVFNKCKSCHMADKEKNRIGPHLVNLFGRTAGTVEDFKYSPAMKESGIVWSPETLTEYLKKPKDYIPGNKMVFVGLKKDKQIVDLIAFLEETTKKE